MNTTNKVYANVSTNITKLKRNPMQIMKDANGEIVVVLNRDEPAFYLIPADKYERINSSILKLEEKLAQVDKIITALNENNFQKV